MRELGIDNLSKAQRIDLVLELCESIEEPSSSALTGMALRQEIMRRAKRLEDHPETGVEWENVEQELDQAE